MGAVTITQTDNPAGVTADGSFVCTYTNAAIGAAFDGRLVIVAVGKEVATVTTVTVTIGGIAAQGIDGDVFGSMRASLWAAPVPTGTTATILVEWSGAITNVQNHIAVYVASNTGYSWKANGTNTSTDMDATAPLTTGSTTIPVNGAMLAVAACADDTVGKTWANLTEDLDVDAGDFRFTTAMSTTAGTATRTCTGGTNLEDGVLVWAILSEAVLPTNSLLVTPTMVPPSRQI